MFGSHGSGPYLTNSVPLISKFMSLTVFWRHIWAWPSTRAQPTSILALSESGQGCMIHRSSSNTRAPSKYLFQYCHFMISVGPLICRILVALPSFWRYPARLYLTFRRLPHSDIPVTICNLFMHDCAAYGDIKTNFAAQVVECPVYSVFLGGKWSKRQNGKVYRPRGYS